MNGTSVVVVPTPACTTSAIPCVPPVGIPQSWDVLTESGGVSAISSLGRPVFSPGIVCPQYVVLFQVTIDVILPPAAA